MRTLREVVDMNVARASFPRRSHRIITRKNETKTGLGAKAFGVQLQPDLCPPAETCASLVGV